MLYSKTERLQKGRWSVRTILAYLTICQRFISYPSTYSTQRLPNGVATVMMCLGLTGFLGFRLSVLHSDSLGKSECQVIRVTESWLQIPPL